MKPATWIGELEILTEQDPAEVIARARDSRFYMIVGHGMQCHYLCLPDWGIGIELPDPFSTEWVRQRLQEVKPGMRTVDAISITAAAAAVENRIR